ncbi:MAG TPA: sterol desaturase family protein [Caulobacteraceae bacterium]|jgi:sterol desaturase/sphingolipid hydroxylase (fatty acid hydroxylase superfamily)|nr:sterol desaturase family protein [Caulobacteraceae bacterium]
MADFAHLFQPFLSFLEMLAPIVVIGAYLRVVEVRSPIDAKMPAKDIITDWMLAITGLGLAALPASITGACAAFIVNAAGGGLIQLRTDGPWYFVSLIALVIVTDLYRYWFHRMQHTIPLLWELHSFHHSAESITFITGARHHWIERVATAAILPVLPILFKIPPSLSATVAVIFLLPDTCSHTNVRLELGRAVTWINNPQWHRIHHSTKLEHRDKNFASVFPLWDFVFGTAWAPKPNEYPPAGLIPSENVGFVEGVIWPFRKYLRRYRTVPSAGPIGSSDPA